MTIKLKSYKYKLNGEYTLVEIVEGKFYKFIEQGELGLGAEYFIPEAEASEVKYMKDGSFDEFPVAEVGVSGSKTIGIIANNASMKHNMKAGRYYPQGTVEGKFYKLTINNDAAGLQEIYVPIYRRIDYNIHRDIQGDVRALLNSVGGSKKRTPRGTKKMRKPRRGPKKSRRSL